MFYSLVSRFVLNDGKMWLCEPQAKQVSTWNMKQHSLSHLFIMTEVLRCSVTSSIGIYESNFRGRWNQFDSMHAAVSCYENLIIDKSYAQKFQQIPMNLTIKDLLI